MSEAVDLALGRTPGNQAPPLVGHQVLLGDPALTGALGSLAGDGAPALLDALTPLGLLAGDAEAREHAHRANENPPRLRTADRYGHRLDEVDLDPSWHWLMSQAIGAGLGGAAWSSGQPSAHLRRAAAYLVWSQVEQGHLCPVTMTYAAVPALAADPGLAARWTPGLTATAYDPGLRPPQDKAGLLAGMAMTEKQGGSDLRGTVTTAVAQGQTFRLTGHKWFTSAPMDDVFLTLARTPEGVTCFVLPRVLPDGSRNGLQIVRLKDKLGNRSNASAEIELHGATAWRLGPPGQGIRTIIEMVAATRMDCILGSAAITRRALSEAAWHAAHRSAFGATLIDQPAMTNVLADLTLESEAATVLGLRLAAAVDRGADAHEQALRRIGLPLGKFWVCKRTPAVVAEALECLGGNGYVEESGLPLLYREAPLNSVWEGSGTVNALDVLRALEREPATLAAWREEVQGADRRIDQYAEAVLDDLGDGPLGPGRARQVAARMALCLQAALLRRHGDQLVADAFVVSRLETGPGGVLGTLEPFLPVRRIAARAVHEPASARWAPAAAVAAQTDRVLAATLPGQEDR